jgi:uncharacterized membrane protein required for colicin V production
MLFSLFVVVFIGIVAYWHYLQGFFSAAISALLAIVAALVAVGYHEQIAAMLAGKMNDQANAVALVLLFAVTYFLLRLIFDSAIPGNVRFPVLLDRIGAPIMGLIAGIFGVGVLVIAAQTLPFGPSISFDKQIIIHQSGKQSDADAIYDEVDSERFLNNESSGLWVGVDDMVLNVMKKVSAEDGPLSRGSSFADVHPDYLQELFGQRTGLQSAANRTVTPGKTTVQSVHVLGPLMQVDPERWNIGGSAVGIRGKGITPPPPPLDPQRTPAEGKVHLVVRVHFSKDDADKKTNMVCMSAANVRLVAKSLESTPARFKNFFPIGTLEGGRILYVNAPDDYMFVPAEKSADFVFDADEDGIFTAADSSDKTAPRKIAPGVFLEVKRLARISLAGMTAERRIDQSDQVEVVRKEGAPANAIVSGTAAGANTAATKAATLVSEGDVVASTKLFTPLNVGTPNENERNGLTNWGSFSLQGKKFSKLEMSPTQTIALMSRGDNLVSEFAVPSENAMVQVPTRVAQGHGKWEWANSLGDFRLVDSAGKRYTPYGVLAKVVNNQNQEMLAAAYDSNKPATSIAGPEDFRPTDITLIYLVPKGVEIKSFDFKEEPLRPVNLKAQ